MRPAPSSISAVSSRSSSSTHPDVSFTGYFRVGFVKSAHGIRGELFIQLFAGRADWESDELQLLAPGESELRTYEIETLRPHKEGLIVQLAGVKDRNASEALRKSQVYIPESCLESEEGDTIFLKQISGFELTDKDGQALGRIEGFSSNGMQDLLEVRTPKGISLVPFVDDFIVDIDFDKKQVRMDLPPGLLD
jgi:16S rRNA processing protein RimM